MFESDVLISFDFCDAGATSTHEGQRMTELNSAYAQNTKTNWIGYYSLPNALLLELKALALKSKFSLGDLYYQIDSRTQNRMPDDE